MATSFYEEIIEEGKQIGLSEGEKIGMTKGEELKAKKVIFTLQKKFPNLTDQQLASIVDMPVSFVKKVRMETRKHKKDIN